MAHGGSIMYPEFISSTWGGDWFKQQMQDVSYVCACLFGVNSRYMTCYVHVCVWERERDKPSILQKVECACHFGLDWSLAQGVPSEPQNTKMIPPHPSLQTILGTEDRSYPIRHIEVLNKQAPTVDMVDCRSIYRN